MNITTEIHSLFVLLLALITLAATFLALWSAGNAIRLRNVRMSWKSGKLAGYPLFSGLFLMSVLVMFSVIYYFRLDSYYTIFGCYAWMSGCWWVSSFLASKHFITDHGIVKNINDPSQTIAWHQICDYVEKPDTKGSQFIFMYQNGATLNRAPEVTRLELFVPDKKVNKFEKIVSLKIGKTMMPVSDTSFNIKTIE